MHIINTPEFFSKEVCTLLDHFSPHWQDIHHLFSVPQASVSLSSLCQLAVYYQLTVKVHGSVSLQLGLGSATAPRHGNPETAFFFCAQSCPTLCDPMDCNPPGSSVHGIFQARILGWTAISSSRGSSQPRDWTQVFQIAGRFFTTKPPISCSRHPYTWEIFLQQIAEPQKAFHPSLSLHKQGDRLREGKELIQSYTAS